MPDQTARDEAKSAMRKASIQYLIAQFPAEKRPLVLKSAAESIETLKELFPEVDQQLLGGISEAIGATITQLLDVTAYALSDTLDYSMAAYLIAAAVLRGDFELPEETALKTSDPEALEALRAEYLRQAKEGVATVLDDLPAASADDDQTGMYL